MFFHSIVADLHINVFFFFHYISLQSECLYGMQQELLQWYQGILTHIASFCYATIVTCNISCNMSLSISFSLLFNLGLSDSIYMWLLGGQSSEMHCLSSYGILTWHDWHDKEGMRNDHFFGRLLCSVSSEPVHGWPQVKLELQ